MKILIALLLSGSCFAKSYIHISEIGKIGGTFFTSLKHCKAAHPSGCKEIGVGYKYETHKIVGGEVVEDATKLAAYQAAQALKAQKKANAKNLNYNALPDAKKNAIFQAMIREYLEDREKDSSDY